MINFNEINQEDLEAAAQMYDGLVKGDFYDQEEKARQWMIEKIHDGVKLGGISTEQGG